MRIHRVIVASLFALASTAAWSAPAPVIVKQHAPAGADTNLNIQSTSGSACSSPSIGNCGSCSVACPTGQAAMCKPGMAVNAAPGASCVAPPECACK